MDIRLKKILVPTDFSDHSANAMRYGYSFATQYQSELHVLHVVQDVLPYMANVEMSMTPAVLLADMERGAREQLDTVVPEAWQAQLQVTRALRRGSPFVEIIRYAKETDTDLIVMGTHGRSGIAHMLLGSVAEKVVRKAPCPVLTVRSPEHEFVMP